MNTLLQKLARFYWEEEGVTAIEYTLIASLVALAFIAGATALGANLRAMFDAVAGKFPTP